MSITMWSGKDSEGREVLRLTPDKVALYRAAPSLFESLKFISENIDHECERGMDKNLCLKCDADAAIAKARGV